MKNLKQYIQEGIKINSKSKVNQYNYHPKDINELSDIIDELIKERGNNADLNDIDTSNVTNMYGTNQTLMEIYQTGMLVKLNICDVYFVDLNLMEIYLIGMLVM